MILEIRKGSAAEMASLMLGDILIGADGRELETMEDFERVLYSDGDRVVRLQFLRGDRTTIRTVAVALGVFSTAAA
jgi:S1-C subfamily serine protease